MAHDESTGNGEQANEESEGLRIALGAVFGALGGVILFVITSNALWIALGPVLGILATVLFTALKSDD